MDKFLELIRRANLLIFIRVSFEIKLVLIGFNEFIIDNFRVNDNFIVLHTDRVIELLSKVFCVVNVRNIDIRVKLMNAIQIYIQFYYIFIFNI